VTFKDVILTRFTQDKLANLPHHHFLSKAGNLY